MLTQIQWVGFSLTFRSAWHTYHTEASSLLAGVGLQAHLLCSAAVISRVIWLGFVPSYHNCQWENLSRFFKKTLFSEVEYSISDWIFLKEASSDES